jgi:hypothetical protein
MTTTIIHLLPTRRIHQAFSIEKNGTGIEKNGTGIEKNGTGLWQENST